MSGFFEALETAEDNTAAEEERESLKFFLKRPPEKRPIKLGLNTQPSPSNEPELKPGPRKMKWAWDLGAASSDFCLDPAMPRLNYVWL